MARSQVRDAFDFSEITPAYLCNLCRGSAETHAGEVGYLKDEIKGDPIIEFVGHRPKMYSFTGSHAAEPIPGLNDTMDMWHKAVATGVSRAYIRRFKHDSYVRMSKGGAVTNVVNRRIGSKLHQVRVTISI